MKVFLSWMIPYVSIGRWCQPNTQISQKEKDTKHSIPKDFDSQSVSMQISASNTPFFCQYLSDVNKKDYLSDLLRIPYGYRIKSFFFNRFER